MFLVPNVEFHIFLADSLFLQVFGFFFASEHFTDISRENREFIISQRTKQNNNLKYNSSVKKSIPLLLTADYLLKWEIPDPCST